MASAARLRLAQSCAPSTFNQQEPALLCVRGKGLYGIGQLDDALKHFGEALRLDPDHSSSRQMRNQIKVRARA